MTTDQMSDTPKTDALLRQINEGRVYETEGPEAELCRQLERAIHANNAKVKAQCDGRTCNDRSEDSPCPNCPMEYWIEI